MKVLCLTSSILDDFSISNGLVKEVMSHLKSKNSHLTITEKHLGEQPPAHLTAAVLTAIRSGDIHHLTEQQKQVYQEILHAIDELKTADMIIIGAPMYNLSVSSGLKTWIDQICQAGLTFSYTENGPKGLVNNKPVIIVSTRGGMYSMAPYNALDHQESYLQAILGLVGITDIKFIRAEGVNISPEMKEQALKQARLDILSL